MPGNIARRPNGKWRARYRDRSGREHARHFADRLTALRWLEQAASPERLGPVTFAGFYDDWSPRQLWARGTVAAMSLTARTVPFRQKALAEISRRDVEAWIKCMDSGGLAPGTVRTRYVNARSVFRAAVREGLIPSDPADDVRLPRRRRIAAAMSIPTPQEVGALLQSSADDFRAFIALCAFAGLRLGEAAGVQVGDVDLVRAELRVTRQVQRRAGGGVEILPPKYQSERLIGLAPDLLDLLRPHLDHPDSATGRWLFDQDGAPLHQGSAAYLWRRTSAAAGLSGIRMHDLRHFYASGLIAAGCDVVSVQRALGHASANTTLGTYAHLWPSAADRTRDAAQSMLWASLNETGDSTADAAIDRGALHEAR